MTELVPIRDASSDELELGLLRSADVDEPSPGALSKTAVALGLGAGVASVATPAGAAGAAIGSGLKLSSAVALSALKALAIGTASGVLVSAGAHAVWSESAPEPVAAVVARDRLDTNPELIRPRDVAARVPSQPGAQDPLIETPPERLAQGATTPGFPADGVTRPGAMRPTTASGVDVNGRLGEGLVDRRDPASAPASRAAFEPQAAPDRGETKSLPVAKSPAQAPSDARSVATAPSAVSIAEEVRSVDRARRALASGNGGVALEELERYQARWPKGVFSTEVRVLRVEAKLKLGDRTSALREARALIDAHPSSRHAARLRSLLGIAE